jgi:integrase
VERAEIKPLDSDAIPKFLDAIKGDPYELVYVVTLFTGMREGEVLGLTWNCVDFDRGTITISKQLQKERRGTGAYHLVSTKNGKSRRITPAKTVMEVLQQQRQQQTDWKRFAGEAWEKSDFVFTDPGTPLLRIDGLSPFQEAGG